MAKPRSIFEEVGEKGAGAPAPGPVAARLPPERRGIAVWLAILFALVVAMIVVGGLTRLTNSGLSITEWRPVTGALPPTDEAAWQAEFEKYQASPQYEAMNEGMTLQAFKSIYWWEWGHRQLGRLIGLVWGGGFLWFWLRRRIPPGWTPRLIGLGVLGGLQGVVGWWMVRSGLATGMSSVASYRLAVHLGLAFLLLGLIAWYVLRLGRTEAELLQARRQRNDGLIAWGTALVVLAFVQILLGALVAGIDAGRTYVDWPLMGGQVIPSSAFALKPVWTNLLASPGLVQFNHRVCGAYPRFVVGLVAWLQSRGSAMGHMRGAFAAMMAMLVLQVVLGIVTVTHAAPLGAVHPAPARGGDAVHAGHPRPLRRALSRGRSASPAVEVKMELRFTIQELQAYLAEVFPQTEGRYGIVEMRAGLLKVRMTATEADLRPGGTVSGPAMFALADCAYYMATLAVLGREALAVTTSWSIDFMRKPAPGGLMAEARMLKLGRMLSVGDVLIFSDGIAGPVARASLTYSIPPSRGGGGGDRDRSGPSSVLCH